MRHSDHDSRLILNIVLKRKPLLVFVNKKKWQDIRSYLKENFLDIFLNDFLYDIRINPLKELTKVSVKKDLTMF